MFCKNAVGNDGAGRDICFELLTTGVAWAWSSIIAWDCDGLFLMLVIPLRDIGPNL